MQLLHFYFLITSQFKDGHKLHTNVLFFLYFYKNNISLADEMN